MSIQYREHAPGSGLADVIRCYWTIRSNSDVPEAGVTNRVLPDNCIDVIFDLEPGSALPAFLVGPMLSAAVFHHGRAVNLLGVRFRPGAATEFFDFKACDLTERDVEATAVWHEARAFAERLAESSPTEQLQLLDRELLRRRQRTTREATLARAAAGTIEQVRGVLTVSALTSALGVTERRLERSFDIAVGIRPKQVLRVERFRGAAAILAHRADASLSRIAASCGYADQAHLTREFGAFARVTPTGFRAERRDVGFLQDGRRLPP
jgi:AraC-like DNA-binding protein